MRHYCEILNVLIRRLESYPGRESHAFGSWYHGQKTRKRRKKKKKRKKEKTGGGGRTREGTGHRDRPGVFLSRAVARATASTAHRGGGAG